MTADSAAAHRTVCIRQIAGDLIDFLGQSLVFALSGAADRQLPASWADPAGQRPDQACESRLRLAYRLLLLLSAAQPAEDVRAWFTGTVGVGVHGFCPINAIRHGDNTLVLTAALWFAAEPVDLLAIVHQA